MAGDGGTVIRVLQFLNGDGIGDDEHVRLYVGGDQFVEAQPAAPAAGLLRRPGRPGDQGALRPGCAQIFGLPGAAPAPARRPLPA